MSTATKARNKVVVYRSTQFMMEKNQETGVKEKVYSPLESIPSSYIHYGDDGSPSMKVFSITNMVDKNQKVIPKPEEIWFRAGRLILTLPKEQHLENFLEKHPNRDTPENRRRGNVILFERVDANEEKRKAVEDTDVLVKAFMLIDSASIPDLVEYAKALSIDVEEVEELLASGGKKNLDALRKKEEVQFMIFDLKRVAKGDPDKFMKGMGDPLRAALAAIASGVQNNVISFDPVANQYCWIMGTDRAPIQNIPRGTAAERWFAQWLTENTTTFTELTNRTEIAKKATEKT